MNFNNVFAGQLPTASSSALLGLKGQGDYRSGAKYLYTETIELALSAAAATQRPLLVTGPAGCGKSSLARCSAARLGWRYLERSVNSRTEISALLWEFDHLRRLQDAQAGRLDERMLAYVRPAVLWQALDAASALRPLSLLDAPSKAASKKTAALNPAVVLIDEIDKADPDLPNNLLEVLGGLRFEVADTGQRVNCRSGVPLIVITSNDERDLPPAFVRRCISLPLGQPDLAAVAALHFPADGKIVKAALALLNDLGAAQQVSAAELLDFVQACKALQVRADSAHWLPLAQACLLKGRGAARGG